MERVTVRPCRVLGEERRCEPLHRVCRVYDVMVKAGVDVAWLPFRPYYNVSRLRSHATRSHSRGCCTARSTLRRTGRPTRSSSTGSENRSGSVSSFARAGLPGGSSRHIPLSWADDRFKVRECQHDHRFVVVIQVFGQRRIPGLHPGTPWHARLRRGEQAKVGAPFMPNNACTWRFRPYRVSRPPI